MNINWGPLEEELAIWRSKDLTLPIWWRDDDAIAETPEFDQLHQISSDIGMPVHIAIISNLITPSLVPIILDQPNLIPVIHGWRHVNHSPEGAKSAEFGHKRPDAKQELEQAISELEARFGTKLVKLFVPPWNRISAVLLPALCQTGYRGLSTYGPRKARCAIMDLVQINTHIDPIFWRGNRGLVAADTLVSGIVTTLQERRSGDADATEPLGLLTHHLVHTKDVWGFSGDLLKVLLDGGATPADIAHLL